MRPFVPLIANPHLATIASNFWPRYKGLQTIPVQSVFYQTEPNIRVRVAEQRPAGPPKGELVLLHGLEGSSDGGYMASLAWSALQAGYAVHRVNTRGCGGTEGCCNTLYHAGLTSDLRYVLGAMRREAPVTVVGYSLSGNVVLKLAGELGAEAPSLFQAAVAVSTPIDLAACVRALARKSNFLYENRFVKSMKRRLAERIRLQPDVFGAIYESTDVESIRTIYDFDDRITAPHFGFGNADNYYRTQSALNFLDKIRVPTLLLTAQDDPLVPFDVYRHPAVAGNPFIELLAPEHGGHVAFLAKEKPRFWVDETILSWLSSTGNKRLDALVSAQD